MNLSLKEMRRAEKDAVLNSKFEEAEYYHNEYIRMKNQIRKTHLVTRVIGFCCLIIIGLFGVYLSALIMAGVW